MRFVLEDIQSNEVYELSEGISIIGRSSKCRISLSYSGVSRQHSEIRVDRGHVAIKDLGSSNGTKINGKKVTSAILKDGDTIGFGNTKLVFKDTESSPDENLDETMLSQPAVQQDQAIDATMAAEAITPDQLSDGPDIIVNAEPMTDDGQADLDMVQDGGQIEASTPIDEGFGNIQDGPAQAPPQQQGGAVVAYDPNQAQPGGPKAELVKVGDEWYVGGVYDENGNLMQANEKIKLVPEGQEGHAPGESSGPNAKKLNPVKMAIIGIAAFIIILVLILALSQDSTFTPPGQLMKSIVNFEKSLKKMGIDDAQVDLDEAKNYMKQANAEKDPAKQQLLVRKAKDLIDGKVEYKLNIYRATKEIENANYSNAAKYLTQPKKWDNDHESSSGIYLSKILDHFNSAGDLKQLDWFDLRDNLERFNNISSTPQKAKVWAGKKIAWIDVQSKAKDVAKEIDDLYIEKKWKEARIKLVELQTHKYDNKDNLWTKEYILKKPLIEKEIRNEIVEAAKEMLNQEDNWQAAINKIKEVDTDLPELKLTENDNEIIDLIRTWRLEKAHKDILEKVRDAIRNGNNEMVIEKGKEIPKDSTYYAEAQNLIAQASGNKINDLLQRLYESGDTAAYNREVEKSNDNEHKARGNAMERADEKLRDAEVLKTQKEFEKARKLWEDVVNILAEYDENEQLRKAQDMLSTWSPDTCAQEYKQIADQLYKEKNYKESRDYYDRANNMHTEGTIANETILGLINKAYKVYLQTSIVNDKKQAVKDLEEVLATLRPGDSYEADNVSIEDLHAKISERIKKLSGN